MAGVTGSRVTAIDPTRPVIGIGSAGGVATGIGGGSVVTPPNPTPATFASKITDLWTASQIYVNLNFNESSGNFVDTGAAAINGTPAGSITYALTGAALDASNRCIRFVGSVAQAQSVTRAGAFGRANATIGMIGLVGAVRTQETAVIKLLADMVDTTTVATNPVRLGPSIDASGRIRFAMQLRGSNGSRVWTGSVDYRNTGTHFFAWVQRADGTGVHTFVDGVEVSTSMTTGGVSPTINAWMNEILAGSFGANLTGGFGADMRNFGAGQLYTAMDLDHFVCIDGVNVTDANIATLAATVVPDVTTYSGLLRSIDVPVLYWPLQDPSVASGAISQIGSLWGFQGSIQSVGVTPQVSGPMASSFAMRFLGTTASFIDLDAAAALFSSSQVGTFIGWWKGNGSPAGYLLSFVDNSALSLWAVAAGNAGQVSWAERRNTGATNSSSVASNGSFPDSVWHMIAVVSTNSGTNIIYIDGVAVATTPSTAGTGTAADWFGDMAASTYFPTIGARRIVVNTGSVPYKGDIALISVHNTALSAANIAALYAATKAA